VGARHSRGHRYQDHCTQGKQTVPGQRDVVGKGREPWFGRSYEQPIGTSTDASCMAGGPLEDKAFPHDARMATRFLVLQMLLDSHKMHVPVGGLGVEGTEVLLLQVVHSSRGGPLLAHRTIPGRTLLFRNGTHDMKCSV
jgi:hypothetical protein